MLILNGIKISIKYNNIFKRYIYTVCLYVNFFVAPNVPLVALAPWKPRSCMVICQKRKNTSIQVQILMDRPTGLMRFAGVGRDYGHSKDPVAFTASLNALESARRIQE